MFVIEVRGLLLPLDQRAQKARAIVVQAGRVVDLSAGAAEAGLREGMTEREATLGLPGVQCLPLQEVRVSVGQRALTQAFSVLSDSVARFGLRGSVVKFALPLPAEELEAPWLDVVRRLVPHLGFAVMGGAGPDLKTARAFLKAGWGSQVPDRCRPIGPPRGRLFLGDVRELPAAVMWDLSAAQQERLHRLGLETVGEVLSRPLPERRSLIGTCDEPEGARDPRRGGVGIYERAVRRTPDAEPIVDLLSLEIWLRSITDDLEERLRGQGMGACHLRLTLRGETGTKIRERGFFTPLPAHRLFPVLQVLMGTCERPGPVLEMTVEAEGARLVVVQHRLGPGAQAFPGSTWSGAQVEGETAEMTQAVRMTRRGDARLRREVRLALWDPLRRTRTEQGR